jgi:glutaredoxin
MLVVTVLGLPVMAQGGDSPCKSTQAANELRSCGYCREVKRILSDPALEGVTFEVTALRLGASVHMEAASDDARLLLQDFTMQMWGGSEVDEQEHVCDFCQKRRSKLEHVMVDWIATANGVELVLISEEPKFAKWAISDARESRSWVLSSAEH